MTSTPTAKAMTKPIPNESGSISVAFLGVAKIASAYHAAPYTTITGDRGEAEAALRGER